MTYAIQELVIRRVSPFDHRLTEATGPAFDRAGLPAYLAASDPRHRNLYLRHGYQVRSVTDLPDGPPLCSMWRTPMP